MSLLLTGSLLTTNSFYVLQNYDQDTEAASGYVEITADIPQSAIDNSEHVFAEVHDSTEYPGRGNGTYDSVDLGEAEDDLTTTIDLRTLYGQNVVIHLTIGDEGESNSLPGTLFEVPESAPADALDAQFSVATGTAGNQSLNITIVSEPDVHSDGTQYPEYRVDGGSWTEFTSYSGTGTYEETMAAGETSYGIEIRWTNEIGSGADSGTKSASSSTAGGVTMFSDAFDGSIDAGWTFAPNTASGKTTPTHSAEANGSDNVLRITIPDDGTYDIDENGIAGPVLYQACTDTDLDIRTRVFVPSNRTQWRSRGIVVFSADETQSVFAGKGAFNGGASDFGADKLEAYNGGSGQVHNYSSSASTLDHIRLTRVKSTNTWTLYTHSDIGTGGTLKSTYVFDFVPAYVGLVAENSSTAGWNCEFDYFYVSTDAITDPEGGE